MPIQITGFDPTHGPIGTNVTLTLTGMPPTATADNTYVSLGGTQVLLVLAVDPAAGTIEVRTSTNNQSGEFLVFIADEEAESADVFTVDRGPGAPQFTNMQPRQVTHGEAERITLTGTNLDQIYLVHVGNVQVLNPLHTGSTTIRFQLPQGVQPGRQRVAGVSRQYGTEFVPFYLTVQ